MRKYLELQGEHSLQELKDSPEARAKGASCMINVWCARDVEFKKPIKADLFDILKEGEQLPVTYTVGYIAGGIELVKMPTTALEWEKEKHEAVAIEQLLKPW